MNYVHREQAVNCSPWLPERNSKKTGHVDRLKDVVKVLLREAECSTIAIETDIDHIQVVFRAQPKQQLSKIINSVKGVTARRLFQEFLSLKKLQVLSDTLTECHSG